MPIHDWSKVPAGLFHDFHQTWSIAIKHALNSGLLPKGVSALVEQRAGSREGDVLAIEGKRDWRRPMKFEGGVATLSPPTARVIRRSNRQFYAERANRIVIKHHLGQILAVIEIVSPGNKDRAVALRDFVQKTAEFLDHGIHVLVVDLFPPSRRDPQGIHKAIWDEFEDEDFAFPPGKDRILASYEAGDDLAAYVESIAVGDELLDMPLALSADFRVMVPLAATYRATWDATPEDVRTAVETGVLPEPDVE